MYRGQTELVLLAVVIVAVVYATAALYGGDIQVLLDNENREESLDFPSDTDSNVVERGVGTLGSVVGEGNVQSVEHDVNTDNNKPTVARPTVTVRFGSNSVISEDNYVVAEFNICSFSSEYSPILAIFVDGNIVDSREISVLDGNSCVLERIEVRLSRGTHVLQAAYGRMRETGNISYKIIGTTVVHVVRSTAGDVGIQDQDSNVPATSDEGLCRLILRDIACHMSDVVYDGVHMQIPDGNLVLTVETNGCSLSEILGSGTPLRVTYYDLTGGQLGERNILSDDITFSGSVLTVNIPANFGNYGKCAILRVVVGDVFLDVNCVNFVCNPPEYLQPGVFPELAVGVLDNSSGNLLDTLWIFVYNYSETPVDLRNVLLDTNITVFYDWGTRSHHFSATFIDSDGDTVFGSNACDSTSPTFYDDPINPGTVSPEAVDGTHFTIVWPDCAGMNEDYLLQKDQSAIIVYRFPQPILLDGKAISLDVFFTYPSGQSTAAEFTTSSKDMHTVGKYVLFSSTHDLRWLPPTYFSMRRFLDLYVDSNAIAFIDVNKDSWSYARAVALWIPITVPPDANVSLDLRDLQILSISGSYGSVGVVNLARYYDADGDVIFGNNACDTTSPYPMLDPVRPGSVNYAEIHGNFTMVWADCAGKNEDYLIQPGQSAYLVYILRSPVDWNSQILLVFMSRRSSFAPLLYRITYDPIALSGNTVPAILVGT